ncbi:MAG TPA: HEAT repeat domain-containing protein [Lacipirellulaceae bacterium]|nr:HEAT repeat domain-containing protein [Lacipirellulaceae bacterium]
MTTLAFSKRCLLSLSFPVAWILLTESARGDVFELANGGRVEGRLVESADGNDKNVVIEFAGGGRISIPRSQVARVDTISAEEAEYQKQSRSAPDTVEAHWELAEWCSQRKMRNQARLHLERIIELDPNHEQARGLLGYRKKDGQWMTRDDVMDGRGLVMYEGRFVTRQHVELLEREKEKKVSEADWGKHLERLRRWLIGRRQDRADEALTEIESIRDPMAAEAVVDLLEREEDPELKRLWMAVASRLDHQAAVDALVELSLLDEDPELRHQSLEYLMTSGRQGLMRPYIRALKDRDNEIVNRAGAALGQIGDTDAIGSLIDALVTKHKFKIAEGNPDQHSYTFTPQGGGMSFGGGGPKIITRSLRNPDVLGALVTLAGGASFDYDQEQWRRWLAAQAKQQVVDVRRDL